jgi:hypothetical protein
MPPTPLNLVQTPEFFTLCFPPLVRFPSIPLVIKFLILARRRYHCALFISLNSLFVFSSFPPIPHNFLYVTFYLQVQLKQKRKKK